MAASTSQRGRHPIGAGPVHGDLAASAHRVADVRFGWAGLLFRGQTGQIDQRQSLVHCQFVRAASRPHLWTVRDRREIHPDVKQASDDRVRTFMPRRDDVPLGHFVSSAAKRSSHAATRGAKAQMSARTAGVVAASTSAGS